MSSLKILSDKPEAEAAAPVGSESIQITQAGVDGIRRFLKEQGASESSPLRLGVKGGGCSGFSYVMKPAEGDPKPTDHVVEAFGQKVYVDPKSMNLLQGMTLDFKVGLMNAGFKFINPKASKTCGCGESFSI